MTKYLDLSIKEIHELLVNKTIKPVDLVNECLERIMNNKLNAFITVDKEGALKRAEELGNIEVEVDNLLFGIPIAIKDNIMVKDLKCTCASKILDNFISIYDASVINLINDAKMIIIGKTNMDEFAMGSTTESSYYGSSINPWNKNKVPGGSSGGSAVAVSARLTPFALGSDTGGSIRQPSGFTGIVGMKPTYGRVSRYGLVAYGSSLDQIGAMTRNVYENAILLNAICKKDDKDLTSFETDEDFTRLIGEDIKGMKIAIPKYFVSDVVHKEVLDVLNKTIDMLKEKGAIIDYVDIKYIDQVVVLYQIIAMSEASSNLARFDGIRYGYLTDNANRLEELYKKTRSEGFGREVKRRIMIGSYILSGENAKIYYNKALQMRDDIQNNFKKIFEDYDLVIGPVSSRCAYNLNSESSPLRGFMDDALVMHANMGGFPGISIPIGFNEEHLPVGMQIMGNSMSEALIYKLASFIEKELHLDLVPGGTHE